MEVDGQLHAPATLLPAKTRCPFYRRLGEPQDRSGRVRKISPPPGFDPRTVQLVASRDADCAIRTSIYIHVYIHIYTAYNWIILVFGCTDTSAVCPSPLISETRVLTWTTVCELCVRKKGHLNRCLCSTWPLYCHCQSVNASSQYEFERTSLWI